MPAIEDDRAVGIAGVREPRRRAGAALLGFSAASKWRPGHASAHGSACVTGSGQWKFGPRWPQFWEFRWLTLAGCFAHKRARLRTLTGFSGFHHSMALSAAALGGSGS